MAPRNRLLLAAGVVLALAFAPVPPPRTGVAEAVVNSFGSGHAGVRQAMQAAVPQLLQADRVKKLACLKGERDPAGWLGKRLRADEVAPGGPVRVRLEGCRPEEALSLLTALVDAYEAGRRVSREQELYARQVQAQVLVLQGGNVPKRLVERAGPTGRRDAPAVLQRAKLVGSAR